MRRLEYALILSIFFGDCTLACSADSGLNNANGAGAGGVAAGSTGGATSTGGTSSTADATLTEAGGSVAGASNSSPLASGGSTVSATTGTSGSATGGATGSSAWTNGIAPLHTEGRYFKDPSGHTVILRGVSIADPQDVDGRATALNAQQVLDRVTDASQGYYARIVRVPVYPDFWLPAPDTYFQVHLKPLVDHATALGLYVIIDWHEISDVADVADRVATFWQFMAPQFASYTNVLYEVFNEPIDTANPNWSQWKNYAQPWVDQIRQVAPDNVILISGPFYAQRIEGAATDPFSGSNLAYVGHVYPISAGSLLTSSSSFAKAAAVRPVILTEWGYQSATDDVYNGSQSSFGDPLKTFVESHGLSWTAWCADSVWAPTMFDADWNLLTGPDQMGGFVRSWLEEKKDQDQPVHG